MTWHLYVDESGNFMDTSRPSLIGGILLPESAFGYKHDNANNIIDDPLFDEWRTQLWNTIRDVAANGLRNPWWQSFSDIHVLHHSLSANADEVYDSEMHRYDVEHCSENRTHPNRWQYQEIGLGLICDLIRQYKGYIVIFDGGLTKPDVDSTTGYLSILAKGLVNLMGRWSTLNLPTDQGSIYPKLRVHIAERKNTTHANSLIGTEDDNNSPTHDDSMVINDTKYINQLFHTAYQIASSELYNHRNFKDMINSIDIVKDEQLESCSIDPGVFEPAWIGTVKRPNRRTVPCDYICNTYFNHKAKKTLIWSQIVGTTNTPLTPHIIIDLAQSSDISLNEMDRMQYDHSYAQVFCRLMASGFPDSATNEFIRQFKQVDSLSERTFIEQIVSFFFEETLERHNIHEVIDRLNSASHQIKGMFRDQAMEAELQANLHLYLYAMHTHLGDDNNIDIDAANVKMFIQSFYKQETEKAAQLYQKLAIREIVKYTDRFDYINAEDMYNKAKNSWDYHIESINDLGHLFSEESDSESIDIPIEYAKMVSSYLQLIRHIVHEDPSKKNEYINQIDQLYRECLKGYANFRDLSWLHQTMSSLESEYGEYNKAFIHLLQSAAYDLLDKPNIHLSDIQNDFVKKLTAMPVTETTSLDCNELSCLFILQAAVEYKQKNHYLLHHYLRLAVSCINNNIGDVMFASLLSFYNDSLPSPDELSNGIPDIHCRTQILWKIATLQHSHGKNNEAKRYYNRALLYLTGNDSGTTIIIQPKAQTIFLAIAIAIAAEETDTEVCDQSMLIEKLYSTFVARINNDRRFRNPFEDVLPTKQLTHEKLVHLSRKIGY